MKISRFEDFPKGWIIGDFLPSLYQTKELEIAIKEYSEGEEEPTHIHKRCEEITMVLSGKIEMNEEIFGKGDIITLEKGEMGKFRSLSNNVILLCIKIPSDPTDKYLVE